MEIFKERNKYMGHDLDEIELKATRKLHGLDKINGSDKNVGSIEKDIKILEKFLKEMDDVFQQTKINNTKERKALANLLEDYKKQKQESKQWKQMYLDEVDKRVDIILLYNKLLEKNKKLEAKLEFKQWGDLDNLKFEEYMNEFIPIQKTKDKIEVLKQEYEEILSEYGNLDTDIIINVPNENVRKYLDKLVTKIEVLQELIQQEDKNGE